VDANYNTNEDTPMEAQAFAMDDIEDIQAADALIAFTERPFSDKGRGGRHVEFGYALALKKTIYMIGPRENVFHCLPEVTRFRTWPEFIAYLES
jgi:nucleoside 2-deoxyribosyltransferase